MYEYYSTITPKQYKKHKKLEEKILKDIHIVTILHCASACDLFKRAGLPRTSRVVSGGLLPTLIHNNLQINQFYNN